MEYHPENLLPVSIIFFVILVIGLVVAWGFWKMSNLRKSGELLYAWDTGLDKGTTITVPRTDGILLAFLDYSYKGWEPRNANHILVLKSKDGKEEFEIDVSRTKGYLGQLSAGNVYSFGTRGTILGQKKDIKEGEYAVSFKDMDNLDDVKQVVFVLSKTGW